MRNGAQKEAEAALSNRLRPVGLEICSRAYNGHGKARERRDVGCKRGCKSGCECEVERAVQRSVQSVCESVSVSACGCEWAHGSQMLSLEDRQIA